LDLKKMCRNFLNRQVFAGAVALLAAAGLCGGRAYAYTECVHTIGKIYAGDNNAVWFDYEDGPGATYVYTSNPMQSAALSLAITAMTTGHQVVIRYSTDGVDCTNDVSRPDFQGIWLE
jgi:hypothetical protein